MKMYNKVYSHLVERYRNEYTPYVLRSCHYFYEYGRSMDKIEGFVYSSASKRGRKIMST